MTRPGEPIRLAFSTDEAYLPHAATMLQSLLAVDHGAPLEVHLLHGDELAEGSIEQLSVWLERKGVQLTAHQIPAADVAGFPSGTFHHAIWYRILLPQLMPQAERVIYLDADTVVLDSLLPLWQQGLSDHLFGATLSPVYRFLRPWVFNRPGIPPPDRYANSGVLLLNLALMRSERCIEALRDFAGRHPDNPYPEQDALAALYHQRCLFLHPRWNLQTPFCDLPLDEIPWPSDQVLEARRSPAIAHFVGPRKPSHYLCRHPAQRDYLRHRAATPWPLASIEGRTVMNRLLRHLPVSWQARYTSWSATARARPHAEARS